MLKKIIIFLITLNLLGCNLVENISDTSYQNFKKDNVSYSATYLTANYSIIKGDAYTASEILDSNLKNIKLLQLKFFSNLVSGNFVNSNNVSQKLKNHKNKEIYYLPEYIINIKKNNLKKSLNLYEKNMEGYLNLNNLNTLIKLWVEKKDNRFKISIENFSKVASIHELLILENFYKTEELVKFADQIYKKDNLNTHDTLLLAGFYYRVANFEKFEKIIKNNLTTQFDKKYIIEKFFNTNNSFKNIQGLHAILASKLYNMITDVDEEIEKSRSYRKIFLEFSLFLDPNIDISKYSLAEIYSFEKTERIALKHLNSISEKSFFFLASNLKKLSIISSSGSEIEHEKLLFKVVKIWPENKFVLYRLANYYKSKKKYFESIKIYKKILKNTEKSNRDIFLYAANLDKIGKWNEAKKLFLDILEKEPNDTYTLNYLSYKLALKEQDLELALNLIKKALALDPENGYFLDTLGWVEFKRKNFETAVYFLEKSVSILPNSSEVTDHLGDCYLKLNRKQEAIFEWRKAIQYESDKNIIKKIKEKIKRHEHLL